MNSKVSITKAPTDPICPRISVGGNPALGFYCTYRGTIDESLLALKAAVTAMEQLSASGKELSVNRNYKELGAS